MIDIVLLKSLSSKKHYTATAKHIPTEMLDPLTGKILTYYGMYFNTYPEHEEINYDALLAFIDFKVRDVTKRNEIKSVLENVHNTDIPPEVLENTQNQIEELAFSGKLGAMLSSYNQGDDIDLTYEVAVLATQTRERMSVLGSKKWADADILEYLEADADDSGLQFKTFDILYDSLKGLHSGHNVAVVAPTDKGKTSLLCRLAVDFANQAKDIEEYKDSCILYLVNEGLAETITPRLYCTACACTRDEALTKARAGTLVGEYTKVVGKRDAIRLVNIHGMNVSQVAKIIEAHKPYMVITDMTGRIRANGNSKGMNELQELEEVWNSMRELSAMLKFIHIGTIQVSAEGMDNLYPPLTAMQWSKVGIQTTLDLCIMVGALQNPEAGMEDIRGISTPKNKLSRSGKRAENKFEVVFSPELNQWR